MSFIFLYKYASILNLTVFIFIDDWWLMMMMMIDDDDNYDDDDFIIQYYFMSQTFDKINYISLKLNF